MEALDFNELARLEVQSRLDRAKPQAERNQLGQFATPTSLASDILEYAGTLIAPRSKVRFLDPAFGTGAFYSALSRSFAARRIAEAKGYEIDVSYGGEAEKIWSGTPLKLEIADFTRAAPPDNDVDKPNLLICNPPYVRHHHLSKTEKERLRRATEQATGIRLSGYTGLYGYFMLLSHEWMADGCLAGWLVPSEFMDVNYGKGIKEYLLERVTLLRVHRFDPKEVQFDGALVSSAVVWFRNAPPPASQAVEFTYGGTLRDPDSSAAIPAPLLRSAPKWTKFPMATAEPSPRTNQVKLKDLFDIRRGLATGANDFFLLTPEQIAEHQLPKAFLKPILPSPRYLFADEVKSDDQGEPLLDRRLFLLDCNLSEKEVSNSYPALWRYLERGIERGVNERYLCSRRSPWYSQEHRPPAPFLCTYMNRRGTTSSRLFRFILNYSQGTAANVYLMLYPKLALREELKSTPNLLRVVWQALNGITPEALEGEGRVYGGGLHKLEPKELANASAESIIAVVPRLSAQHSM